MNCRSFRKFVGAFADGELDTQANAEALEHLNMCPPCAQRVTDLQQLKQAIVRSVGQEKTPQHLRAAVAASLLGAQANPDQVATGSAMSKFVYRLIVPLGVAAGIVLAIAVWEWAKPADAPLTPGIKTVREFRLASEVRNQHRMCTVNALEHHDASLGRNLSGISKRLTDRLKLRTLAPDLAGRGYDLLGAGQCGVMGRPGGHVLYRSKDGLLLSVFTTALGDCGQVSFGRPMRLDGMEFAVDQRDDLAVVAWTQGCVTYMLCGQIPLDQVLEVSAQARLAFERGD